MGWGLQFSLHDELKGASKVTIAPTTTLCRGRKTYGLVSVSVKVLEQGAILTLVRRSSVPREHIAIISGELRGRGCHAPWDPATMGDANAANDRSFCVTVDPLTYAEVRGPYSWSIPSLSTHRSPSPPLSLCACTFG